MDPNNCPLCGKHNACVNVSRQEKSHACWCSDPKITFSQTLLSKVPAELRGKSCICKACVMQFQKTNTLK